MAAVGDWRGLRLGDEVCLDGRVLQTVRESTDVAPAWMALMQYPEATLHRPGDRLTPAQDVTVLRAADILAMVMGYGMHPKQAERMAELFWDAQGYSSTELDMDDACEVGMQFTDRVRDMERRYQSWYSRSEQLVYEIARGL